MENKLKLNGAVFSPSHLFISGLSFLLVYTHLVCSAVGTPFAELIIMKIVSHVTTFLHLNTLFLDYLDKH